MVSLVSNYLMLTNNTARSLSQVASQPAAAHEIAYFKANIASIKTVDDFMKNTRIYNFTMQAYGLANMEYAKGFIRKVLTEGVSNSKSFANTLTDPRFKALAKAFNFAANGASTTSSAALQQTTIAKYTESLFEQQAGQTDTALQLALYFKANIGNVTSGYGILGDAALYKVVSTAMGLPAAMSGVNIDQQANIINAQLKLSDMKDPKKLNNFILRFLAMYEINNGTSSQLDPAVQLATASASTIQNNTLLALQNIKSFGS